MLSSRKCQFLKQPGARLFLINSRRRLSRINADLFMHPVIYLNKTMVEATKARVAPVSSAMLYGRGVFTTLAIYHSEPFLWSNHWQRLAAHAKRLDIDHPGCNEKNVGDALQRLISVNQVKEGR